MKTSTVLLLTTVCGAASAQNLFIAGTTYTVANDFREMPAMTRMDAAGNVYLVSYRSWGYDTRVTKYAADGAFVWSTEVPGDAFEPINDMAVDKGGNPILVGSANGKLLLAKFNAATGAAKVFRKSNPFNAARVIYGNTVLVDPTDDTIVVAGSIARGSDPESTGRPMVVKYSNDGATQLWISAPTDVKASLSKIVLDKGRIYFGGTTHNDASVYVGYVPATGGTAVGFAPTLPNAYRRELKHLVVASDRLVWTALERENSTFLHTRLQWGQQDFSAEGGGGGTAFTEPTWTDNGIAGVAYDAASGHLAFQHWGGGPTTVRFMAVDAETDGFTDLGSVAMEGNALGIVPLGKGYFGALTRGGFGNPQNETYWGSVVRLSSGWISGTPFKGAKTANQVLAPWVDGDTMIFARGTTRGVSTTRFRFAPGPTNDEIRMDEDTTHKSNIVRNDIGIGTKTIGGFTQPSHAATFTLSASGNLVYKPVADWYGTDTFTYDQYLDGVFYRKRTVTIEVRNAGDGPTAVDDHIGSIDETGTVVLDALANDINPDAPVRPLKYVSVTQPSNATVSLAEGKTVLKIKAKPGAAGQLFGFTYTIENGSGKTSTATVYGVFAPGGGN
ncbi:hypothetical protein EON79_11500 [bacterium]|nr:MAG: hypothetical protein EON79_11500 [bacterium]